ncbi:MAG: tryptophan synthase subunit alpha [Alphaproteobacteria bacterium]|nr:tryptophan synthase subunit alpha [Alphaproteobacteria bacterium]MCL2505437.1 tryptophan synthase subunit alpha [Alphaproteobacteria bacterium]
MSKKFISFITAGDPSMDKTKEFIEVLAEYSHVIEIGLPFSDPIAEGEVIEAANVRALQNRATTDKMFFMLETVTFDKIVILTYANPVFVYGYEKFFKRCQECKVYGVIIPDLPFEERGEAAVYADKYSVHLITLIAPTSAERVKMLAKNATGFIYLVSSMGVTGIRSEFDLDLTDIVKQIREVTDVPIYIGFGISTPEHAARMREIADGVIVGSAFVKIIAQHGRKSAPHLRKLIKELTDPHLIE